MVSPEKSGLLQAFLGSLPEAMASRLAKAVEVDRLADGAALPHDLILDGLRPVLRKGANFERTPTPLRMFCRPFEDLLVSTPRKEKQKGRIARSSVAPVWAWLDKTLIPDAAKTYNAEFKALVLAYKPDEANACALAFWHLAADAIRAAIAKDRKSVRGALLSEFAVADAEEMALLLAAGEQFCEIQGLLPKPVPALSEELLWSLRRIHDQLAETIVDAAPYVAAVAMNRLARPWEALKLPLMVSRQTQDTLISSTDMGLAGDLLFADIQTLGVALRAAKHPSFDAEALVADLAHFTALSSGVVKEIEVRRDGRWGQSLMKDRMAVAEVMDAFMKRAPKEIAAALPTQKSGGFGGGPRSPDFSKPVEANKAERGVRYARLIVGCRPFAAAASFGAGQKDAQDEAMQLLRSYNEDVVKELRTAQGPRREVVERQFDLAVSMTALLYSEEEAELLRRRGRAALAAAA
jgi:hypothetical protein